MAATPYEVHGKMRYGTAYTRVFSSLFVLAFLTGLLWGRSRGEPVVNPTPSAPTGVRVKGTLCQLVKPDNSDQLSREPVGGAIVYLAATDRVNHKPPAQEAVIRVTRGKVEPPLSSVVVGQKLRIEPDDAVRYNLILEEVGQPRAGIIVPPDGKKIERMFVKANVIARLSCGVNPSVKGYVVVLPNRVVSTTTDKGAFEFPEALPPGEYEIIAYHPKYGRVRSKFTAKERDEVVSCELAFPVESSSP